jgi:hypothetical protein
MYKIVLNYPQAYYATHGRSRYSFLVIVSSILKYNDQYVTAFYKQNHYPEQEFLDTLDLVSKNPNKFTLDYVFLMSIEKSRKLTLKCRNLREYDEFYDKLEHDILYYNQISTLLLGVIISVKEKLGILRKLKSHGPYHYKKFLNEIFDYLDDFMYEKEITMVTLIKIAAYLDQPVIIYPNAFV